MDSSTSNDATTNSVTTGVGRVLNKLRASVNAGNYYEAHQMYRSIYFRYLNQRKFSEILILLFDGANLFFENNQQASGIDLTTLFIDTLVKSQASPTAQNLINVSKLLGKIGKDSLQRDQIINNALKWSSGLTKNFGHPSLHQQIAKIFWKEKNYFCARFHFLHSTDGCSFALMLIEVHKERGYSNEIDLFIAQAVLQYLCLRNKVTANETFQNYTTKHPNILQHGPPYIMPLLNFIWFLLKVIETRKLVAFNTLCQQYQPSIKRDPSYADYLNKIGQLFFGIQGVSRQAPQSAGFLGNIISSLVNGSRMRDDADTSSDDDITASTSNSQSLRN